jgi:peptidoglycan hydrolase-like protein with peptidoglycan-binding domain
MARSSPGLRVPPMSKTTIRQNDHGDLVTELQQKLETAGNSPGAIDSWFGPNTEAAVTAFQTNNGLQVDGVVGNQTWAALDGDFSVPPGTSDGGGHHQPSGPTAAVTLAAVVQVSRESDDKVTIHVIINNNGTVPANDVWADVRLYDTQTGTWTDADGGPAEWNAQDIAPGGSFEFTTHYVAAKSDDRSYEAIIDLHPGDHSQDWGRFHSDFIH